PARLVLAQPRLAQIVGDERVAEGLGGELPADQAVVDAAAGGRLDQAGRVADGEQARTVGLRDRTERQDLEARLGPRLAVDLEARAQLRGKGAEERSRARVGHQAQALIGLSGAVERHHPCETARRDRSSEMYLDAIGAGERALELRALHEGARHAEPELPVEAVIGAAREDARARLDRAGPAV